MITKQGGKFYRDGVEIDAELYKAVVSHAKHVKAGATKSDARAKASRRNGKLYGGRPKGSKNKPKNT